jgi:hypothetical protein
MTESANAGQEFSIEELGRLHGITPRVEKAFRSQLWSYLDAMAPLFRPRRVLGSHMEGTGNEGVSNADQSLSELREVYFKACGRPFDLRKELAVPLESVPTQLQLNQWEYQHEIHAKGERRTIKVISPLTWVLSYNSAYNYPIVRQLVADKQERDAESLRSFVLRASLMYVMFSRLPELTTLLEGLRYRVEMKRSAQFGELPLVTLSAPFETVRPSDELLLRAEQFTGRSDFVEVIDVRQATKITDPMLAQVSPFLATAADI